MNDDRPRPHLWEIARPELRAQRAHGFRDIDGLFAALNRPTQAPPVGLSFESRPDDEPDPRVLDWACSANVDDDTDDDEIDLSELTREACEAVQARYVEIESEALARM